MCLLDSIIANQSARPSVVSENHDASTINWVNGLTDPGEMIGCGMYQQLRRHDGENDDAYAERLNVEMTLLPVDIRNRISGAMKEAATRRASLATVNGKIALMTAGKLPWHGLGTNIDKACSWEEAARFSHTDYSVSKQPLYYFDSTGTKRQSKAAWSIMRDDNGEELGSVGGRYKIIQNSEAFQFLDSVIGEFGAKFESAGALYNGSHVFGLVHLPKQSFTVNGGDLQESYAMFMNVHDGSGSAWCFPTSVRAVCANTCNVAMADKKKGLSIRHTGNIKDKVNAARETLGYAVHGIEQYKEQAEALYRKPLPITHYANDVLDAVLEITQAEAMKGADALAASIATTEAARKLLHDSIEKKIERRGEILADILERYESERCGVGSIRGTAWAAWNAVTEHVDHAKVGRQSQDPATRMSRRFESVLIGEGAQIKQTAFEIAMKA